MSGESRSAGIPVEVHLEIKDRFRTSVTGESSAQHFDDRLETVKTVRPDAERHDFASSTIGD